MNIDSSIIGISVLMCFLNSWEYQQGLKILDLVGCLYRSKDLRVFLDSSLSLTWHLICQKILLGLPSENIQNLTPSHLSPATTLPEDTSIFLLDPCISLPSSLCFDHFTPSFLYNTATRGIISKLQVGALRNTVSASHRTQKKTQSPNCDLEVGT